MSGKGVDYLGASVLAADMMGLGGLEAPGYFDYLQFVFAICY